MRLILVHGINQQGRDPEEMKKHWVEDIEKGLGRSGALSGVDVMMPFYGDILAEKSAKEVAGVLQQGPSDAENDELAAFLIEGLEDQAAEAGITAQEIRDEQEQGPSRSAVEMGFPMDRRINAIVSLLERVSPLRGEIAMRFLGQAHAYLKKPGVAPAVDEVVRPVLNDAPAVVLGHSLGTIVTFKLLREMAEAGQPADVRLYVTLGSPLAISAVQRGLGPVFSTPRGIARWINVFDPDDFITLNRPLARPLFSATIENVGDFENPGRDAHAIPGYLQYRPVAQAIAEVLGR